MKQTKPIERTNPFNQPTDISRLVLGTAQLGMNYGISNRTGQPDFKTAEAIVKTAWVSGIREYDTAQGYGESEMVLGSVIRSLGLGSEVKVITKLHPDLDHLDRDVLELAVRKSLNRLNVPILHGLMLHKEEYLSLWARGLSDSLQSFIKKGLTQYLGVSVYSPDKAILALETEGINIVQVPSNILDRRFERSGVFGLANRKKKQIYVRSVFLQGLLLLNSEKFPDNIQFAQPVLKNLDRFLRIRGETRKTLALGYAKLAYPKAKILTGAETQEQVEENVKIWSNKPLEDVIGQVKRRFADIDERILNPVLWGKR